MSKKKSGSLVTCKVCGAKVYRAKSYLKRNPKALTCSLKCKGISQQQIKDGTELAQQVLSLYESGLGTERISSAVNIDDGAVQYFLNRKLGKLRNRSFYNKENNPNWSGGHVTKHGYKRIGGKFEHREIMEKKLGRKLKRSEEVHHMNGIKTDNRIENLMLLDKQKHSALHSLERNQYINSLQERIRELEARVASS